MSLRQICAVSRDYGIVPFGKSCDEVVGVCKFCCGDTFFVGGVEAAVADIIHDASREQVGVLQNHTQRPSQILFVDFIDIYPVVADFAVLNVVKPVDKVGDCRFARARCADKSEFLTGFCAKGYAVQHEFIGDVTEIDVVKFDIPFEFHVSGGIGFLVVMFPRPEPRAFFAFDDIAVFVLRGVDKHDVAVVGFLLFVNHIEHARRARKPHGNHRDLSRDVADIVGKLARKRQEGNENADRQRIEPGNTDVFEPGIEFRNDQKSADERQQYVQEIAHVAENRHKDIAVSMRLSAVVVEFIVEFVKALFCGVFVVEHFHDFLTVYHFFDIAFFVGDGDLLRDHIFAACSADFHDDEKHKQYHRNDDKRQIYAVRQHYDEHRDQRERRLEQYGQTVADKLAHGVGIVGIGTHYRTVLVRIEIFNWQGFHIVEHIFSEMIQRSLRNDCVKLVVYDRADNAQYEKQNHRRAHSDKQDGSLAPRHILRKRRRDDVVDEFLHIDVADKHACRHHQKGDAHYDNLPAVIFEKVFQKTGKRTLFGGLHIALFFHCGSLFHCASPPSSLSEWRVCDS